MVAGLNASADESERTRVITSEQARGNRRDSGGTNRGDG
jgi:hypothetical protein